LNFGPAFPAVMLVSTIVQLGLQLLFQLCQATPAALWGSQHSAWD